jgi:hypothetical protein
MKKILVRIAVVLAILIAAPFVVAAFLRRDFVIEREIVIDRPKDEVFAFIRCLKNQDQYSTPLKADPGMKKSFRGTDGTVGFVYAWESDNQDAGVGEQEITQIREGERVDSEIRMKKPFQSSDPAYTTTETVPGNKTRVRSVYLGKMNYPSNLLCSVVCDKVGQVMQESLKNLKDVLEKQPKSPGEAP